MRGVNPTRNQKKKLSSLGLKWENWLIVKDNENEFVIKHKQSGKTRKCNIVDRLLGKR